MKVTLEFNLPEDKDELFRAQKGSDYYLILVELDRKLRDLAKYQNQKKIGIDTMRTLIREIAGEYDAIIE